MKNTIPCKFNYELAEAQLRFALDAIAPLVPDQYDLETVKAKLNPETLTKIAKGLGTRVDPEKFHDGVVEVDDDAVLGAASRLGMIIPRVLYPAVQEEEDLNIYSHPSLCREPAKAIVVMGAAGLSNMKRIYHAIDAVISGAVDTDTIIVAAGKRQATESERKRVEEAGCTPGDTEYDLCRRAILDLSDQEVTDMEDTEVTLGGHTLPVRRAELETDIHPNSKLSKKVKIIVIECPFDPSRELENGKLATRPNTEENLAAVQAVLNIADGDTLYVVSHDCWTLAQILVAERVFPQCNIYGSGPQNLDRIMACVNTGEPKLCHARDVQDEIRKIILELVKRLCAFKD